MFLSRILLFGAIFCISCASSKPERLPQNNLPNRSSTECQQTLRRAQSLHDMGKTQQAIQWIEQAALQMSGKTRLPI